MQAKANKTCGTIIKLFMVSMFLALVNGCAPTFSNAPLPPANTPEPTDSAVPTSEMVPVEQVTDLPTHLPTTTAEALPAETSIAVGPGAGTDIPATVISSNFDSLLDLDANFEAGDVHIKRPGQLSRITSPFLVIAYVDPASEDQVQITLLGEDGRTLDSKKVRPLPYLGNDGGNLFTELEFQIEGLSELARLEVSTTDQFGRLLALNSVDILLLSVGETDRNYTPETQERIIIQYPLANYMVQGDTLLVSGLVRTSSNQPLSLTLTNESGEVIGQGNASVVLSEEENIGLFIGEIPFSIETPIWVRLSVAIPGERIPGEEYIKSMEIVVGP